MKKVFAVILFIISVKMLFFDRPADKKEQAGHTAVQAMEKNHEKG